MKFHVLQHAAYEGPGEIAAWAQKRGHTLAASHLYRGDALPELRGFDALVVMGGEMNIYQDRDWPWLKAERAFVAAALDAGNPVVGICLGSQLIADALGARVVQNPVFEIGWLPVRWTPEAAAEFDGVQEPSTVLHWHGDTFNLPEGATRLAVSDGCAEQGFVIPGKCLALQFHIEVDPALVKLYVDSQNWWPKGPYVQEPGVITAGAAKHCAVNSELLHGMLDKFFS
ncbi:MAG TPA: type 1 glutamine amidotransferase [Candidatus Methylacidiphilales bacterium]|jgi:GMP synthase (glutamine-hydrolysing)|nr:type 1 glutamine amidotransferase [Candidatus Methylacidiphilales bacterium]